jgi:hypothetical protein
MRDKVLFISILLVAALAASCGSADDPAEGDGELAGTVGEQLDEAIAKTRAARGAAFDFAYAQRAEFVGQLGQELDGIQVELVRLSAKVDNSRGAAKADAEAKLDAVRGKWAEAKRRLDRAGNATESEWDDAMGEFKQSYGELRHSFELARQWMSDAIEP